MCRALQSEVAGQARIVLSVSAVNKVEAGELNVNCNAAQFFPPDPDVPKEGSRVRLMFPDGRTFHVRMLPRLRYFPISAARPACPRHPQHLLLPWRLTVR